MRRILVVHNWECTSPEELTLFEKARILEQTLQQYMYAKDIDIEIDGDKIKSKIDISAYASVMPKELEGQDGFKARQITE